MTKEEKIVGQCKSSVSKELMENLLIEFDEMGFEPTTLCDNQKEVDSFRNRLKQVLDYLKGIDNSNPSEALEKLLDGYSKGMTGRSYYDAIKQALLKSQEQEKVLEIIKEKKVDIIYLEDSNNVNEYNSHFGCVVCKLTQEEFDTLKRCCNEEKD